MHSVNNKDRGRTAPDIISSWRSLLGADEVERLIQQAYDDAESGNDDLSGVTSLVRCAKLANLQKTKEL